MSQVYLMFAVKSIIVVLVSAGVWTLQGCHLHQQGAQGGAPLQIPVFHQTRSIFFTTVKFYFI